MRYITIIDEKEYLVEILDENHVAINGELYDVDFFSIGNHQVYSLLLNNESHEVYVYPDGNSWQVFFRGESYCALVEEEMERRLRMVLGSKIVETSEIPIKAPMPGLVVAIPVNDGQEVSKGDVLVILESMKMQNELKAPRSGVVSRIRVNSGEGVEHHQTLMTLV